MKHAWAATGILGTPAVTEAADENFVVHATWTLDRLPGAMARIDRDLVIADSGLTCDTFNFICRARLDTRGARQRAVEAIAHFAGVARRFSWWVGPADRLATLGSVLEDAGLERAETELAMAADLRTIGSDEGSPPGLDIRLVSTRAALQDLGRLSAGNWSPPDENVIRFYELAEGALLSRDSPQRFYVGYVDDEPVATAEVTLGGGVAGLFNISTIERFRRRGFGSAMTRQGARRCS